MQAEKFKNEGNEEFKRGNFAKAIDLCEHCNFLFTFVFSVPLLLFLLDTLATEQDPSQAALFSNRSNAHFKLGKFAESLR